MSAPHPPDGADSGTAPHDHLNHIVGRDYKSFVYGFDWASTPLGPLSQWPYRLQHAVNLVLADTTPAVIMWGSHMTLIHNEAFAIFAGQRHQELFAKSAFFEGLDFWPMLPNVVEASRTNPQTTRHQDVRVHLHRKGYKEECYMTYVFVPLLEIGEDFTGYYHTAVETTSQILGARRNNTLLSIWDAITLSSDTLDYWRNLAKILQANTDDLRWAFAYSFISDKKNDLQANDQSVHQVGVRRRNLKECVLIAATIEATGKMPLNMSLENLEDPFVGKITEAIDKDEVIALQCTESEDFAWLFDLDPTHDLGPPCRTILLIPVRPTTRIGNGDDNVLGFLIVGINPFLEYNEDFAQFVKQFMRQIGTSAASVMLSEQVSKRQDQLERQLKVSQQKAEDFELRLSRFVEVSNIGMWIASPEGALLFANKAWYSQAELLYNTQGMHVMNWMPLVAEDSLPNFARHWETLMQTGKPVIFECKFKALWRSPDPVTGEMREGPRWFLISAAPEFHEDGTLKSSWGCNVDVSYQKWAQSVIDNRLKESIEAKRQTDNFIDLISHEIRNPLSAILQSADGIANTLSDAMKGQPNATGVTLDQDDTLSVSELASIVVTCAQHQKRIVDDVLTLSKLDASLLEVTPDEVDPLTIVQDALKLHQQEFKNANIDGSFQVHYTYYDLGIHRVLLDPSRLLQVLINLLTNAIKFTRSEPVRQIKVHLAASTHCSDDAPGDAQWFMPRRSGQASSVNGESEDEEQLYLHFAVEDTGCGLSDEDMRRLFTKFSQASPKTHVQYGGSGLGLFICKELTELQGGRIGVTSRLGEGSKFKFYIRVQRANAAENEVITRARRSPPLLMHSQDVEVSVHERSEVVSGMRESHNISESVLSVKNVPLSSIDDTIHVLVVEDNLINQKVMANQLRKANCVVYTADHGVDALDFLRQTTFWKDCGPNAIPLSIVLMDLEMPVMDGLSCVAKIRELERLGDLIQPVPTIAITANARWEQVKMALDYGMNDVATKPLRIKDLLPRIHGLLNRSDESKDLSSDAI